MPENPAHDAPATPNLHVFDHPLIRHKLAIVRDSTTQYQRFRSLVNQIAGLMLFEVSRAFPVEEYQVQSPMELTTGVRLARTVTVCPILRAGLGMSDGLLEIMPEARVGHIGMYRDEETLEPVEYLCKLPANASEGPVILVDPMLATGGSAVAAVKLLMRNGITDIRLICLVAAPEGVRTMHEHCPAVPIYAAALDRELNENGFILPGLGDAGDRIFGTK